MYICKIAILLLLFGVAHSRYGKSGFEKNILMTYSLNRRFGEYGESSEKNLLLKSDVYVLAVGVESYRFDFNF